MTGGAGFVGSHLVEALVGRGEEVVILDDLSTGRLENVEHVLESGAVRFVEGSTCDAQIVDRLMADVDTCFHLASAVGVQLIVNQPLSSLLGNVRGTDIVISAAARHDRMLLFTSTSEVYGKNSTGPLHEDSDRLLGSPFKSRWTYATAKSFGESLAHAYHREQGLRMVVVRLFNTVGPRQTGKYGMVLPRFVEQAVADEDLTVYGNGTQSRSFCHVADTVEGILRLVDCPEAIGGVYNVGATTPMPVIELARRVIERTGSASRITLVPFEEAYEDGFEETGCRQPDTGALQALTGWRALRTIDEAIDDVALVAQRGPRAARHAPRLVDVAGAG